MGILDQQLIGGGEDGSSWSEKPFGDARKYENVYPGFGGYTYAQNKEMQLTFNTTPPEERTGPIGDVELTSESGDQYGSKGRRLPDTAKTILGEMAQMLKTPAEGAAVPEWSSKGGGKRMAYLFMESRSLRSLRDQTGTVGESANNVPTYTPHASGGAFTGYDPNNHYGISNWMVGGGAGTEAVEGKAATWEGQPHQSRQTSAAVEGVEGSNKEIFNQGITVQTGLRNLPPFDSSPSPAVDDPQSWRQG